MKVKRKVTRQNTVWRTTGKMNVPGAYDLFMYACHGMPCVGVGPEVEERPEVTTATEPVTVEEEVDCPEWIERYIRNDWNYAEEILNRAAQRLYDAWVAAGEPRA